MISFTLYLTLKSFVNKLERNSASFKEDHSNIYPRLSTKGNDLQKIIESLEGDKNKIQIRLTDGDCLELLKKLDDKSIDLIFLDPPYNLQLNKELTRPNHSVVNGVSQDWDKFDNYQSYDQFTYSF